MYQNSTVFRRAFAAFAASAMTLALFVSYFATPSVQSAAAILA